MAKYHNRGGGSVFRGRNSFLASSWDNYRVVSSKAVRDWISIIKFFISIPSISHVQDVENKNSALPQGKEITLTTNLRIKTSRGATSTTIQQIKSTFINLIGTICTDLRNKITQNNYTKSAHDETTDKLFSWISQPKKCGNWPKHRTIH